MNLWSMTAAGAAAVAGLGAWASMHPSAQLFGPTLRHTADRASIALTFDDGPNPALTPRLLDLLDRHAARATFFLIGRHARTCPELAKEIADRGHVIANHTETHPSLIWLGPARIAEELARCQEAIERAIGRRAEWMRPPYGFRGPQLHRVVRRSGLRGVVMWSRSGYDWTVQPAARVVKRLERVRAGDIVLLHDGAPEALGADRRHTLAALEYWLPRWQEAGLKFITVDLIRRDVQPTSATLV